MLRLLHKSFKEILYIEINMFKNKMNKQTFWSYKG